MDDSEIESLALCFDLNSNLAPSQSGSSNEDLSTRAWSDWPPFAYHWGLEKAKQHLKELGAPEPEMPAFDESKFEPMPEVEINPHDEFYVDESAESE